MVRNENNAFQNARLEWMIIWLIMIEVFFAVIEHFGLSIGSPQKVLIDNCDEIVKGIGEALQKHR